MCRGAFLKTFEKPLSAQEEAIILARQAEREMMQNREIKVRCPKCGTMPRITNTLRGERFVVSCDCGYIYNCEIY